MIIDASAMVEVLLQTAKATAVEAHLLQADNGLHAPHLIDIEVAQALRRFVLRGAVSEERGTFALRAQAAFPLRRHAHAALLPRLWIWRNNLSAYDAIYVALAEALRAPLLTCDARLAQAAGGLIAVHVV